MDLDPIALAVPLFFVFIGLEIFSQWRSGEHLYRANDALANINCGILEQLTGLYAKVLTVGLYQFVYQYFSLFKIPNGWLSFVAVLLLCDFFYYWAHRKSHEINFFWGGHVVHHQSEEYNLSVALRQGSLQTFFVSLFYLPMALIGFDTYSFMLGSALVTLYQFWIHTEKIGKLGYLEKVFNTPSHHRVHHGRDPKYIDKNHAGILIIWDKLFGTFQVEEEHPHYGITQPLNSWNPVWANLNHFFLLAHRFKKLRSWKDRLHLLFDDPGWQAEGEEVPEAPPLTLKYDPIVSPILQGYAVGQFSVILLFCIAVLFIQAGLTEGERLLTVSFLTGSILPIGALFDRKAWAQPAELLRLGLMAAVLVVVLGAIGWIFALAYLLGSLVWFKRAVNAHVERTV